MVPAIPLSVAIKSVTGSVNAARGAKWRPGVKNDTCREISDIHLHSAEILCEDEGHIRKMSRGILCVHTGIG